MPQDTINDPVVTKVGKKLPLLRREGSLGTREARQSPVSGKFAVPGAGQSYRVSDPLVLSMGCHKAAAVTVPVPGRIRSSGYLPGLRENTKEILWLTHRPRLVAEGPAGS